MGWGGGGWGREEGGKGEKGGGTDRKLTPRKCLGSLCHRACYRVKLFLDFRFTTAK